MIRLMRMMVTIIITIIVQLSACEMLFLSDICFFLEKRRDDGLMVGKLELQCQKVAVNLGFY
jgi:hypothetical protein